VNVFALEVLRMSGEHVVLVATAVIAPHARTFLRTLEMEAVQ
jgi:hypothetical protein